MAEPSKRYAVVTGANKGIGFEICRQLASNGIMVVLTARDEKRGLEAFRQLKESGLSELVVFHQLDVADSASIASLADFIRTQFGKLDILVNNAAVNGIKVDGVALRAVLDKQPNWFEFTIQTLELAKECLEINYYGAKRVAEALVPLLQLSDSPRIVNVSSSLGKLKNVSNEWAKGVLGDAENLTEERVDEVLKEYLRDLEEGSLKAKGWPPVMSAYILSKAAINAYTRILATKHPNLSVNSVCPGYAKTDLTKLHGDLTAAEAAENAVRLALLPAGGPSGNFYIQKEISCF